MCVCAKEIYVTSEQWSIAFHRSQFCGVILYVNLSILPSPSYIYSLFPPFVMVTIGKHAYEIST